MANGDLGVQTGGGGETSINLQVNIINQTDSKVQVSEKDTPDGKQLEVLILGAVANGIAQGKLDGPAQARWNVGFRGRATT